MGAGRNIIDVATSEIRPQIEPQVEVLSESELNVEKALDQTGFGTLNYKITMVSGLIYANTGAIIPILSFILPSAACDFDLDTVGMERLSSSLIVGMLLGSTIWGCVADAKGRRVALLYCLFIQAFLECVVSLISHYWGFLVVNVLIGITISGQLALLFVYVAEFQPRKYREKALAYTELPSLVSPILTPIVAWLILPLDIGFTNSYISFKSWNLFVVLVCGIPPFIIGCMLLTLPETPKYLVATGRKIDLRTVLSRMYHENTGNPAEEFIVKLDKVGLTFLSELTNETSDEQPANESNSTNGASMKVAFRTFFWQAYEQTWMLVKKPYTGKTITCLGSYCIITSAYTLTVWFTEIFQRFADFDEAYPGNSSSVCIVSEAIARATENATINLAETLTTDCDDSMSTQVYFYAVVLGAANIPVSAIFMLTVQRLGFRFFLVLNSLVTGITSFGLMFVTTSTENLIVACIYQSFISVSVTVITCLVVEVYPTNLRVTASLLASFFGRAVTLACNTAFGHLLDHHCHMLFTMISAALFLSAMLGILIPKYRHKPQREQDTTTDSPPSVMNNASVSIIDR